jgi:hypothetical protein
VAQLTFNDEARNTRHCSGNVGEQAQLLAIIEQVEQSTRLRIVIITNAMILTICIAGNAQRWFLG